MYVCIYKVVTYGTTAASAIEGWLTRRDSSSAGGTWMNFKPKLMYYFKNKILMCY